MTETHDVKNSIYISSGRISDHEIPTLVSTRFGREVDYEIATVFTINTVNSGTYDIVSESASSNALSNYTDDIIEFVTFTPQQSNFDVYAESTSVVSRAACIDMYNYNHISDLVPISHNLYTDVSQGCADSTFVSITDDLFVSGDPVEASNEIYTTLRVTVGTVDADRHITTTIDLSSVMYFSVDSSIYCTDSVDIINVITDVLQDTGRVVTITSDLFAVSLNNTAVVCDITLADVLRRHLTSDLEVGSGKLQAVDSDIFNTNSRVQSLGTDIKTRSLFVVDFFVQEFEFVDSDSTCYVDIVDFLYAIVDSSITITIDGIHRSILSIESIGDIKRVYFAPDNGFYSEGEIVINVYAVSSIGEVLDHDFVLLYGYNVVPSEVNYFLPNTSVVVRGEASNVAFCPNKEALSFYFTTMDYDSFNLNMSIIPTDPVDLGMVIYPQSTAFFYGKTYTVTISGIKDFAGNDMEPFEYSFTIEKPSNIV